MAKSGGSGGMTPMMKQYHSIRKTLPEDVLLFFRLGDFYELFLEDAKEAAGLLDVALTKRNGMSMCGVPHHAAEGYIGKLIKAGRRVAIAEQTTDPVPGKIVEREVTQIISAGTINDLNLLDQDRPNFLAAVFSSKRRFGLAVIDHTTGEFKVTELPDEEALDDELKRLQPSELLFSEDQESLFAGFRVAQSYDSYAFLHEPAEHLLLEHFGVQSLDGFGCGEMHAGICAAGAVLHYIRYQMRRSVGHLKRLQSWQTDQFVLLDAASQENLDLVTSRAGAKHSLLAAMDRTSTPMGARKLRQWILHPLRDIATLEARQEMIAALLGEPFLLAKIRESLMAVRDVERILGRLSQGAGNARDMQDLKASLAELPNLNAHLGALGGVDVPLLADDGPGRVADADKLALISLIANLSEFPELVQALEAAIVDEPPAALKEGGIFRDGFRSELDELRSASRDGKQWIAELQQREAERTGIKSLKVKFNNVFGYFIEVTKSNLDAVPDDYTRKQTTTNAERFITPELKEVENKILGADERARQLEYEEFLNLRETVIAELTELQRAADAVATLDVLCGLAETARLYHYCRPILNEGNRIAIKEGRHPVLDQSVTDEKFVPNDAMLDSDRTRLVLLTGPNMAGKSTYIRQVALITLMAQTGSFVPAASAEIGIVDRIFTRVGASDDISRGQSTFMVEMHETAAIVNNATDRSLVILDEIGRGTATFDGLSIAWSVAEHLHDRIGCRTIFATHYHELTALAKSRPTVENWNVAVREWNDRIIFLRKIVPGAADKSYGIQVARLAGLPREVLDRAKDILNHLETN
ncbi:MAG: DNA mismatch repair protein MutS, partial [Verrucomicrobiota bacterium]